MRVALESTDGAEADAILPTHAAVLGDLHANIGGRWRDEQVWIGGASSGPHGATFVPPHHSASRA